MTRWWRGSDRDQPCCQAYLFTWSSLFFTWRKALPHTSHTCLGSWCISRCLEMSDRSQPLEAQTDSTILQTDVRWNDHLIIRGGVRVGLESSLKQYQLFFILWTLLISLSGHPAKPKWKLEIKESPDYQCQSRRPQGINDPQFLKLCTNFSKATHFLFFTSWVCSPY